MPPRAQTTTVLRMGGWTAYLSGAVAAIGLLLWFARFAFPGSVIAWLNDVFVMIQYALAVPIAVSLHSLLRRYDPGLSLSAMVVGIGGMLAVVVLQFLLVVDALTFAQQVVPVTIAILVVGLWLVITGYLGRSTGRLPHSLRMSLIAVPYFGYPIWAFWLGRHLLDAATSLGDQDVSETSPGVLPARLR
jgi:hypothetical protein